MKKIIVDNSWSGMHGIGRFTKEVISRLNDIEILGLKSNPLCFSSMLKLSKKIFSRKDAIFFTSGFNPPLYSNIPYVFTIHDLIHLKFSEYTNITKNIYYNFFIKKYASQKAAKILTVSEYSKRDIVSWLKISDDKVVVVGNGVSDNFCLEGKKHNIGQPYLFCLGNTKLHKNIKRLFEAFASSKIDCDIKLLIAAKENKELLILANKLNITDRLIFAGMIAEEDLPNYYRGALAFIFPSLYEGFGLPILEAMACGTPVITANITAMPEVADDAALLVDPYNVDTISEGIELLAKSEKIRMELIEKGINRAKNFTWDKTAYLVQQVLDEVRNNK